MADLLSLFDEQPQPQNEATPSLAEVLKQAIDAKLYDTRTAMPAKVIRYDHEKQQVDVQPYFKKKYNDGKMVSMPKITNVPVVFPRSGAAFISMPIEIGHNVLLVCVDRSMDKWLSNGDELHPDDTRRHNISDAVAMPGLYPFSDPADVPNATDIVIKNKAGDAKLEIRVKKNGHIQILNQEEELITVLNDMLTYIRQAKVYTSTGPQKLRHSKFAKVQTRLKKFLEK